MSTKRQHVRALAIIAFLSAAALGCTRQPETSGGATAGGAVRAAASLSGLVVLTPTSGGSITDGSGAVWTLPASGCATRNGTAVAGGCGTSELTYVPSTRTIWGQDAGSKQWYSWNGTNWVGPSATGPVGPTPTPTPKPTPTPTPKPTPTPTPKPTPTPTPAPMGGQVILTPTSGGSITDGSGAMWTLPASGCATRNGTAVAGGCGTSELTYVPSTRTIWGQDAGSKQWYSWNGSTWVGPSATSPIGSGPTPAPTPAPTPTPTPAPSVSPSGTTIPPASRIVDSGENVWTVVGGVVQENGANAGTTANVTLLLYYNGGIYQQNSAGGWWIWGDGTWAGTTDPRGGSSGGTGRFVISGGQILDPNGKVFIARGFNFTIENVASTPLSVIQSLFPRTNYVRITNFLGGGYIDGITPQSISSWVTSLTSQHIVVQFSDYPGNGICRSGSDLANANAWYQAVASFYAGNPYVWFESQNECYDTGGGAQSRNEITTNYNAVRAGAPNAIFLIGSAGGSPDPANGEWYFNSALFAPMTNVVFDIHPYAGAYVSYAVAANQSAYDAELSSWVSSYRQWTSASGAMPVIAGEFGNATVPSSGADPTGPLAVQAGADDTTGSASTGLSGVGYWEWNCGCDSASTDTLVVGTSAVNPFGVQVQGIIANLPGN